MLTNPQSQKSLQASHCHSAVQSPTVGFNVFDSTVAKNKLEQIYQLVNVIRVRLGCDNPVSQELSDIAERVITVRDDIDEWDKVLRRLQAQE